MNSRSRTLRLLVLNSSLLLAAAVGLAIFLMRNGMALSDACSVAAVVGVMGFLGILPVYLWNLRSKPVGSIQEGITEFGKAIFRPKRLLVLMVVIPMVCGVSIFLIKTTLGQRYAYVAELATLVLFSSVIAYWLMKRR